MPPILMLALALIVALPAQAQTPPQPAPYRPAPVPQAAPAPKPASTPAPIALVHIDKARQLWRDNRLLQALDELDAAAVSVARQLGQAYAPTLPPAPPGWAIAPADPERAASLGSDIAAVRDYRQTAGAPPAAPPGAAAGGPGQMNARIIVDSSAVQAIQPLFGPQMPQGVAPTVRKLSINNQDAVVAYDPQRRAGEVSMIVGNRLLIQVEGQNVSSAEPMLAVMRQWNTAALRRIAGL